IGAIGQARGGAALTTRVVGALGASRRAAKQRRRARGQPTWPVVAQRAVVLVRQHDDRDQRVGTQKRGALLQYVLIDALGTGVGARDHDAKRRLGVDQKAIPRLERGLVTAAALARRLHLSPQFIGKYRRIGVARGLLLAPRIPRQ